MQFLAISSSLSVMFSQLSPGFAHGCFSGTSNSPCPRWSYSSPRPPVLPPVFPFRKWLTPLTPLPNQKPRWLLPLSLPTPTAKGLVSFMNSPFTYGSPLLSWAVYYYLTPELRLQLLTASVSPALQIHPVRPFWYWRAFGGWLSHFWSSSDALMLLVRQAMSDSASSLISHLTLAVPTPLQTVTLCQFLRAQGFCHLHWLFRLFLLPRIFLWLTPSSYSLSLLRCDFLREIFSDS